MSKDDDLALWRKVAETVKPLERRKVRFRPKTASAAIDISTGPIAAKPSPKLKTVRRSLTPTRTEKRDAATNRQPVLSHGETAGVDGRTAGRLRRGKLPIEATLDLHGHRQDDAHRALIGFVTAHHAAGRRCLLVVTGKGLRGESGGVLRQKVPLWLNAAPLRDKVLAFDFARPEHGGSGAIYLLLRRKRDRV